MYFCELMKHYFGRVRSPIGVLTKSNKFTVAAARICTPIELRASHEGTQRPYEPPEQTFEAMLWSHGRICASQEITGPSPPLGRIRGRRSLKKR